MATIDIASLSLEERLRPLDELGESLSRTPEAIPMTPAQREELDRRLDDLDREGPIGISWAPRRPPESLTPNPQSRTGH
jgi:putative addiction module component (TIGR02574 family)